MGTSHKVGVPFLRLLSYATSHSQAPKYALSQQGSVATPWKKPKWDPRRITSAHNVCFPVTAVPLRPSAPCDLPHQHVGSVASFPTTWRCRRDDVAQLTAPVLSWSPSSLFPMLPGAEEGREDAIPSQFRSLLSSDPFSVRYDCGARHVRRAGQTIAVQDVRAGADSRFRLQRPAELSGRQGERRSAGWTMLTVISRGGR